MVKKGTTAKPRSAVEKTSHLSSKLAAAQPTSSVITASAFSPAGLKLGFFASTVQGLDAYRIRVHDTTTGRQRAECVLESGVVVNSLAWGVLPPREQKGGKKKRKRLSNGAGEDAARHAVVAAATSQGTVLLFSPSEGAIVTALEGGHVGAVRQFVFAKDDGRGWSCGADGKLVEWDIARKIALRTVGLPESSVQRIAHFPPRVLAASHTVYAVDYDNPSPQQTRKFTANTTPVHSLLTCDDEERFLSAADSDRFINVFTLSEEVSKPHLGSLVAESDVKAVSYQLSHQQGAPELLAAVTADGVVELFRSPFDPAEAPGAADTSSRKRKTITRSSEAKIRIIRPDNSAEAVAIADATLQGEEVIVAWVDSGVSVAFQKVRWASPEDGSLVLSGTVEIARTKSIGIGGPSSAQINGVKDTGKTHVDQASTIVTSGADMQDVDMDDVPTIEDAASAASESESESEPEHDDADKDGDVSEAEPEEPSFADRFQALDVSAKAPASLIPSKTPAGAITTYSNAGEMTTVLTQALRTSDAALLETCLHNPDTTLILPTVRRLPSPLVVTLLEKLTERLARRPGRAGSLGTWVRWTLVAHGGYLVTQPGLMRTLAGLHATLNLRANALPRLLSLQGRLDMLHSQVELRGSLESAAAGQEEAGVVYVEAEHGESEDASSDEEDEEVGVEDQSVLQAGSDSEAEEEGFLDEDEDEDEDSEDEEEGGVRDLLDTEAEEATEEEDEDGVDWDDEDEEGTSDLEETPAKPKVKKVGRR